MLCLGPIAFLFGDDDFTCADLTVDSGAAPSTAPPLNTPSGIDTSDMAWHTEQVQNAAIIISVGMGMGVPVRWIIAPATRGQAERAADRAGDGGLAWGYWAVLAER